MGMPNRNGTMIIDFPIANDLVIGRSLFHHRDVHECTWTSLDGSDINQINCYLV